MKRWIKLFGIGIAFTFLFLLLTFPYGRFGPKITEMVGKGLSQITQRNYQCEASDFSISWDLRLKFEKFECSSLRDGKLFSFDELKIFALPFYQMISAKDGEGSMRFSTDVGFSGMPSRVQAKFQDWPVRETTEIVYQLGSSFLRGLPFRPELDGQLTGSLDLPLQNLHLKDGSIQLNFENLRLPPQSMLKLIGLTELGFIRSVVNVELLAGQLRFDNVEFVANELGAKLSGELQLAEELQNSAGAMAFKWKVQKSDALLNSVMGTALANAPCPSPDTDRFCTMRFNRLSEIQSLLSLSSGF